MLSSCIVSRDYGELTCLIPLVAVTLNRGRGGLIRGQIDVVEVGIPMDRSALCLVGVGR